MTITVILLDQTRVHGSRTWAAGRTLGQTSIIGYIIVPPDPWTIFPPKSKAGKPMKKPNTTKLAASITGAGREQIQARPIRWTDDANRIARLFCKHDPERLVVTVHTPLSELEVHGVNPQVMDPCGIIGMALAGQPLGETEKILRGVDL